MKTTKLLIFLLFFAFQSRAQATGFAVIENKLVWENVFVSGHESIQALLSKRSRLKVVSAKGKVLKGTGKNIIYKCSDTSLVLSKGYGFVFEVELVDGKYRVTVSSILFNLKKGRKNISAENHFLVDGKIKDDEASNADLTCLDSYLNRVFSSKSSVKNKL